MKVATFLLPDWIPESSDFSLLIFLYIQDDWALTKSLYSDWINKSVKNKSSY